MSLTRFSYQPLDPRSPTRSPRRCVACCTAAARRSVDVDADLLTIVVALVMKAISDRHYEMMHPSRQSPSEQDAQGLGVPALTFSGSGAINMPSSNPPVIQVYISVPPVSPPNTATWPPSSNLSHLPRRTDVTVYDNTYEFVEPRLLRTIDPRVTFVSTSQLPLYSRCNVYRGSTIVHVGDAAMMVVQPMTPDESGLGGFLHYTNLAPGYWDTLCSCDGAHSKHCSSHICRALMTTVRHTDLSPYSVVQEITKQSIDPTQKAATVMHIQYQFMQTSSGQSPRSLSPFALNAEVRPCSPYRLRPHGADCCRTPRPQFDYDADSGSDIFPLFSGQMSTGSESPLPSDRSSSPSHSIPTGFSSQPISPTGWVPQEQWTPFSAAASTNPLSQFPTSGYYDVQQPQHHQAASYHSGPHQSHQPSPPGQFLGPPSF